MISAKIIADSLSPYGHRITTFQLTMPRIILAEFNTHRMISRNSASSRAIPFEKMVQSVKERPFMPIAWMKDHKGMQGNDFFSHKEGEDQYCTLDFKMQWLAARDAAVKQATNLSEMGLSKQMCNRLLEPFMWHTVIATGTEWENFFALRAHPAAEIHMQLLAQIMLDAYNANAPKQLKSGEWHIPFGDNIDLKLHYEYDRSQDLFYNVDWTHITDMHMHKVKIATARCARVSYTVIGEEKDLHNYEKDIILHDRLAASGHFSPFEHCAQVMTPGQYHGWKMSVPTSEGVQDQPGWCKNYRGFVQYRAMLHNENKSDNRIQKTYAQQSQHATASNSAGRG